MRKALETVNLFALATLAFITIRALYGPARLPDRIPTHYNAAGQANGWGPSFTLLIFPGFAVAIYLLMSLVSRFPSAFNYPVRVTAQNRQRLQDLALGMIAWLKTEIVVVFTLIEWSAIRAAGSPGQRLSPLLMPTLLVAVFATCIIHTVAMFTARNAVARR
jgi:uncharacterized membrane protein